MAEYATRKLEVFSFHARVGNNPIPDYAAFCNTIAAARRREVTVHGRQAVMVRWRVTSRRVYFLVMEGEPGVAPIIFKSRSEKAVVQRIEQGDFVAQMTHGGIDLDTREAVIEYNHAGAKAADIAILLASVGQRTYGDKLQVDLNPVVNETFLQKLERFERIRIATVKLSRPNVDWNDQNSKLADMAADSNGHTIEVNIFAGRGESLYPKQGIIQHLKDLARKPLSIFKGAKVKGTRPNEAREITVSLDNHVEMQTVRVRRSEYGHVDTAEIQDRIENYLNNRKARPKNARSN